MGSVFGRNAGRDIYIYARIFTSIGMIISDCVYVFTKNIALHTHTQSHGMKTENTGEKEMMPSWTID